ncbi:MAG: hypothetical protein LBD15_01775 [Holosporales bacterium]|nr:hypothetical protein [Holosporales bacterium]
MSHLKRSLLRNMPVAYALRFPPVSTLAPLDDYSTFIWGLCCDMTLWGVFP